MAFTLSDFSDIEKIGEGGMATVYKAVQRSLNRVVAIKELSSNLSKNPVYVQRFENEARAAATLDNENIIRVFDFGTENDRFYIVMEFAEGYDFDQLLKRPDFPMDIGVLIVLQASMALEFAHQLKIVHRDVKPANILVRQDGKVKLSDFGLAYVADNVSLTGTGSVVGTPQYMSPEQIRGQFKNDTRTDIFSMGVILYQVLTGELPFKGDNLAALLYGIVNDKYRDPRDINPKIPKHFVKIIDQCLDRNIDKRLRSLQPLVSTINAYLKDNALNYPQVEIYNYVNNPQEYFKTNLKKSSVFNKEVYLKKTIESEPIVTNILTERSSSQVARISRVSRVQNRNEFVYTSITEAKKGIFFKLGFPILLGLLVVIGVWVWLRPETKTIRMEKTATGKGEGVKSIPITRESERRLTKSEPEPAARVERAREEPVNIKAEISNREIRESREERKPKVVKSKSRNSEMTMQTSPTFSRPVSRPVIPEESFVEPRIKEEPENIRPAPAIPREEPRSSSTSEQKEALPATANTGIGNLWVFSKPYASLFIDGKEYGNTPKLIALKEGEHDVLLLKNNWSEYRQKVLVRDGETLNLRINLSKTNQ